MNPVTALATFDASGFLANNVAIVATHASMLLTFTPKMMVHILLIEKFLGNIEHGIDYNVL